MKLRISAALAAFAVLAVAIGTAAAAVPAKTGATPTVKVTLMDGMLMTSTSSVRAGTVMFSVVNKGKSAHNFVVIKTKKPGAMLPMKGAVASETGRVAKSRLLAPGRSQMLMVKLAKGSYAVICNVPGHYMMGMRAALRVA